MTAGHLSCLLLLLFLTACAPTWQWQPKASDTRQFIRYDEEPGMCFGYCPSYFIYIFEDGEIVYHGSGTVALKGGKRKKADPALFHAIMKILERNQFDTLAPRYWPEFDVCGEGYFTDSGQIHLTLSTKGRSKNVIYDYGCHSSPDAERILAITEGLQSVIPVANWVGREHFKWNQQ